MTLVFRIPCRIHRTNKQIFFPFSRYCVEIVNDERTLDFCEILSRNVDICKATKKSKYKKNRFIEQLALIYR